LLAVRYGGKEDTNWSDGLLISILVRYPEIATINFDPIEHVLKFAFISSQALKTEQLSATAIEGKVLDSIEVFNLLEGRKVKMSAISYLDCDQLTIIEVQRDIDTLAQEEISLIVQLIREFLGDNLVTETDEFVFEDDPVLQEEIIEYMLESMKRANGDRHLFAFREEGRVMVFNK
jgi:hypothetical protein